MAVIRELTCNEEEKALASALKCMTVAVGSTEPLFDDPEGISHSILSSLSGMGYKIVEGVCDVDQRLSCCNYASR